MGDFWAEPFVWLSARFSECFLLPGGSDSRRIMCVEYPFEFALVHEQLFPGKGRVAGRAGI